MTRQMRMSSPTMAVKGPQRLSMCSMHSLMLIKKSCIRETSNLSTDADRRTDTILERLRDLSKKKIYIKNIKILDNFFLLS